MTRTTSLWSSIRALTALTALAIVGFSTSAVEAHATQTQLKLALEELLSDGGGGGGGGGLFAHDQHTHDGAATEDIMGVEGWHSYRGLPVVGALATNPRRDARVVTVGAYYNADKRDIDSLYACTTANPAHLSVLLALPDGSGGVLLKIVENRTRTARNKTDGWYLGVLSDSEYAKDSAYEGFLRLTAHRDPQRAATFQIAEHDAGALLQVKDSRDSSGKGAIGWYLSIPPGSDRNSVSDYVAFGPDISTAVPVMVPPILD